MKSLFVRWIALASAVLLLGGCAAVPEVSEPSRIETATTATTTVTTAPTTTAEVTATTEATATQTTTTAVPTTTAAKTDRERVREMLQSGRIAKIYKATYDSIFSRVGESGYFQESVTGRYKGEYVRSIGALVKLALETGQDAAAARALKFVTDTMTLNSLSYFPFTISADKKTVRKEDEPDGRAHFVLGWALYALQCDDADYEDATYAMVAAELDKLLSQPYFYGEGDTPAMDLVFNRRFTHTRMKNASDYWQSFDLLTNCFVAAAAENMIAVAAARGDGEAAARWQAKLDKLAVGINERMVHTVDGKEIYLELYTVENGKAVAEKGYSWVCLSPAAAGWSGTDTQVLTDTAKAMYKKLWKTTKNGGYLAVECAANGTVKNWILGKSVGWDIETARLAGDYAHILEWFLFLEKNHGASDIYMETMKPSGSSWKLGDCGNGEQCIWFIWALARLRNELGLSPQP